MHRMTGLVVLVLLGTGLLGGCGGTTMKRLGDPSGSHCPTRSTGTFAQARFSAHVGVAAATLRHWVWKPYRQGRLDLDAAHRDAAVARAAAGAHAAALEYRDAAQDVSSEPTRCELLYSPLTDLANALDRLDTTLHETNQAQMDRSLTGLHEAVVELRTLVRSNGVPLSVPASTGPGGQHAGHRAGQHGDEHPGQHIEGGQHRSK